MIHNHMWLIGASLVAVVLGHITYIEVRLPLEGTPPPPGSPWPMPQLMRSHNTLLELDPDTFEFKSDAACCDIIDKAMKRYKDLIFLSKQKAKLSGKPLLKALRIEVRDYKGDDCGYPQHMDNENYTLSVDADGMADLTAPTVWGALRGLETFSQIVYNDENTNNYFVNVTEIYDYPRYGFRGILLDTSRHYQPIKTIKQHLDAMSYNKFNTFHWHIVDDQSWPYQMKVFPNLTDAAYHPKLIYTQKDIKDIIDYARERGIRVIPEIDTPGHTQAIGKIFPRILTACYGTGGRGTPRYPDFAAYEMLNPMQNYTYDLMKTIFQEVKETFPDQYIHLGMDEVYYKCWESSPEIKAFMTANNMTTVAEVEQYYVKNTLENVKNLGAKYMIWQDPIDNGVKAAKDTIVGVWKDVYLDSKLKPWREYLEASVKHGYQIVLSAPWYLNYISYGQDWRKYYEIDPNDFNATSAEKDLVIGGEACIWGEYADGTNMVARLWPRAGAVGERLWSDESVNDTEAAKYRLDEHRCRMVRRGIPAEPILNGYCGGYDWEV